jgi:sugar phosphate isomerase/epimerase
VWVYNNTIAHQLFDSTMTHRPNSIGKLIAICSMGALAATASGKTLGLQLYSLRDAMAADAKDTIAQVGAMGFSFVEAAGYGDGKFYGMEPEEFRDFLAGHGLEFVSSHTGQDVPDAANWDRVMAWWDEAIGAHQRAGVQFIVQPWMGARGFESLEGLKAYCDYFNAVGAKCKEAGIRFGFHNHAKEFDTLEGVVIYDYMLENTDPELVMFQIDLYWTVEGGKDPVDYFKRYAGRFELWHVKDEKELGESGRMDFERFFKYRELSGVQYLIVEQEKYSFDPITSVAKSFQFMMDAPFVE